MRDDSHRWSAPMTEKWLEHSGFSIKQVHPARMTLISGPCEESLKWIGQSRAWGWPDIVLGNCYALQLRRDRILVMNGPDVPDGWDAAQGLATSDMTGGYAVFEIQGRDVMTFLQRGTEIDVRQPSKSVSRAFHGLAAMIYRFQNKTTFRLHVSSPMQDAFWQIAISTAGK